ncbi:MAG: amidohydrolase [Bacteroidetes bacterium]|nr:MAG: amidohydrolase [Bacteroidota bacterium]
MKKRLPALLIFLVHANLLLSQSKDIYAKIDQAADRLESQTISWRRDFHEHPELSNREFRTAKIIADHLKSLGLEVREGVAKSGVVGILRGAKPGPVIGLRADMDALPIEEKTNLSFASKVKSTYNGQEVGVMHACGHDSHVAMLMTVAEILSGLKNDLKGTVKFIFQPAEESPPPGEDGGAPLMIKEGVLDGPKVDVMFGLHIESGTEVGKIKYRSGPLMAASDWFTITVKGKGAHGSEPWNSIDPVVVSAQIIQGIQNIVSRQTDLTKQPAVISVCVVKGGVRSNIIPEEVVLTGTMRTFDKNMEKDIYDRIRRTSVKIAESAGATADVVIENKTLVVVNNAALVKKMLPSLQRTLGDSNVVTMDLTTKAEDFSFFADKVPSFFFFLGGMKPGQDPKTAPQHHTAEFYVDESAFKIGVKTFCRLVLDYK